MEASQQREAFFPFEELPRELRDMVYGYAQKAYDVSHEDEFQSKKTCSRAANDYNDYMVVLIKGVPRYYD